MSAREQRLTFHSPKSSAEVIAGLRSAVHDSRTGSMPAAVRATRVAGITLRVRGHRFVLHLRRTRRVLAPLICRGSIRSLETGCIVDATIRPSRVWILVPAAGSLMLAISWMISAAPPATTLRYALLVGLLWALNIGLASVPVGSDPAAEQSVYATILAGAAGVRADA